MYIRRSGEKHEFKGNIEIATFNIADSASRISLDNFVTELLIRFGDENNS